MQNISTAASACFRFSGIPPCSNNGECIQDECFCYSGYTALGDFELDDSFDCDISISWIKALSWIILVLSIIQLIFVLHHILVMPAEERQLRTFFTNTKSRIVIGLLFSGFGYIIYVVPKIISPSQGVVGGNSALGITATVGWTVSLCTNYIVWVHIKVCE